MAIEIRNAERDELAAVVTLWREPGVAVRATDTEAALLTLFESDAEAVLVAAADGDLIGVLLATWDGWRGNMYRLAVRPERRREGIARALVEDGERRLRARGCRRVTALVNDDDTARAVWRACGYEPDPHVDRHVKMIA